MKRFWPGGRLALRVYLVGLAQTAVIAAGFSFYLWVNRPEGPGPAAAYARYVADTLADHAEAPDWLETFGARAARASNVTVWLVDADDSVIAGPPGPRPCGDARRREPAPTCATSTLVLADGRTVTLEVQPAVRRRSPTALGLRVLVLVLVVVGASSWLLARSLARPLRRLTDAARAFGSGDRKARANLRRQDELGEVARAFDDMADRVTVLLRSEKELLANVSHELRTPLARIRVALDLAAEQGGEHLAGSLADVTLDLEELERLISDVLTAARLDLDEAPSSTGLPPLRLERVATAALVGEAAARFRARRPARRLVVVTSGDLPALEIDPVLMRRVLDNLLENAHKYAKKEGDPIEIRARRVEEVVQVEVLDTGIGISADDLGDVFRPFFRADKSRTRSTGGLGLGLALARKIVESHGGTIVLESVLGQGTIARVTLPASPDGDAG